MSAPSTPWPSPTLRTSPTPLSLSQPPWPRHWASFANAATSNGPTLAPPDTSGQRASVPTGPYILGGEELTLADAGESVISYADYAIAMIDEIETGNHLQQRVSTERKQHSIVKCSSKSGNALPLDTASLTRRS